MEIDSPLPLGARARNSPSCSPALHREWRRAATAATSPRCRQDSSSARRAPLRPACFPCSVTRAKPVPPRRRPRRRWERATADSRSPSRAGRDLGVRVFVFSGTRAQKIETHPPF
jgi:hypothetical protein